MNTKKTIQILMSTYNGEKYITEQIDSILNQSIGLENMFLLVRDDGSTDGTIKILDAYKNNYPNKFDYFIGENLGPCYSFLDLVNKANKDFDYFAFSDQDDFWLPEKLEKAVEILTTKNNEIPQLYSSKYTIVDSNLNVIEGQSAKKVNFTTFENSLIENVATGCTEVFNKEMLTLLNKANADTSKGFFMHDWVLYMLGTSLGEFTYDENAYLLYRQHENNVLGASRGKFNNIKRKFKNFQKYNKNDVYRRNVVAFNKVYGSQCTQKQNHLMTLFSQKTLKDNCKFLISNNVKRQSTVDTLIFKLLILVNYL